MVSYPFSDPIDVSNSKLDIRPSEGHVNLECRSNTCSKFNLSIYISKY